MQCGRSQNSHLETLAEHLVFFVKISRLYQPRSPLFWIMVTLNVLSAVLGWITHKHALGTAASLIIAAFAVGNAVLGTYLAWRLLNS